MLEMAARTLGADATRAFVIGDKLCDIEMARRAGATPLLVRTGWGRETEQASALRPDHVADDLLEVARVTLAVVGKGAMDSEDHWRDAALTERG